MNYPFGIISKLHQISLLNDIEQAIPKSVTLDELAVIKSAIDAKRVEYETDLRKAIAEQPKT